MHKLNPFDAVRKTAEKKQQEERHKKRMETIKELRKTHKQGKVARRKPYNALWAGLEESFRVADKKWEKMENEFKVAEGKEGEEEEDEQ